MQWSQAKRTCASFLTVLVLYAVYSLLLVPWMEPPLARRQIKPPAEGTAPLRSTDQFLAELRGYFPHDAWELDRPKVLNNHGVSLLFQDYKPREDGSVHIFPCTVFLQDAFRSADGLHTAPLIMQAPEGAVLYLDQPLDISTARLGSPKEGQLLGEVEIFSPGTVDGRNQLRVVTSNVKVNAKRIWTPNQVDIRFDGTTLAGRDLMISLAIADRKPKDSSTAPLGVIRWLELMELHNLHLVPESFQVARNRQDSQAGQGASQSASRREELSMQYPIDVQCAGTFRIDMLSKTVVFEDDVRLVRHLEESVEDRLQCDRLTMRLSADVVEDVDQSGLQRVIAEGQPAVLTSAQHAAAIRGRKLLYDFPTGRVRLWADPEDADDRVQLTYSEHDIAARELDCELDVDSREVKRVRAAGPGRYQGRASQSEPMPVAAWWHQLLRIDTTAKQHTLTLVGDAGVRIGQDQQIEADEIYCWLEPIDQSVEESVGQSVGQAVPTIANSRESLGVRPVRVLARGRGIEGEQSDAVAEGVIRTMPVRIETARLNAMTERLDVRIEHVRPSATQSQDSQQRFSTMDTRLRNAVSAASPVRRSLATAADDLGQGNLVGNGNATWNSDSPPPGEPMGVVAKRVDMRVRVEQQQAIVQNLTLTGQAHLEYREVLSGDEQRSTPRVTELLAERITADSAAGGDTFTVVAEGSPVRLLSPELTLETNLINLDQAENVIWTERPGIMSIQADRDLQGKPLTQPQTIETAWGDTMRFDGKVARFVGRIDVRSRDQRLRCQQLAVEFEELVTFQAAGSTPPRPSRMQADGNVLLEARQIAEGQLQSVSFLRTSRLDVDQQRDEATAAGPGELVLIKRGFRSTGNPLLREQPVERSTRNSDNDDRLTYVKITYQGRIDADTQRRIVNFRQRVQLAYGPVFSWNDELNINGPLDENAVLLSCEELTLSQGPDLPNDTQSFNFQAIGNTYIEGHSFTARGNRVAYEQYKDLLILEGTANRDAVLSHQTHVGGRRSESAARRIFYWPKTGRVTVDDARYLDLSNLGL